MLSVGDGGMNDYMDIMSICAFDVSKAAEMNDNGAIPFSAIVEETLRECGLERIRQGEVYVHRIPAKSYQK